MKRKTVSRQRASLMQVEAMRPSASNRIHEASPAEGKRDWLRIENKTAASADVYIYDEIGFWGTTAAQFQQQLAELDVAQINLHINSPGGDVFDGVAIYNSLVNHKAKVIVSVDGIAASAASFIAQSGDEVIMGEGSMMMIHDAWGMAWGNAAEMHKTAEVLNKISDNISTMYAARAGGTPEEWRGVMIEEAWYSAAEAVDAGLADRVAALEDPSEDNSSAENSWNLSVFNYAGRDKAPSPDSVRQTVLNRISKESPVGKPIQNSEVEPDKATTDEPVVIDAPSTEGVEPAADVSLVAGGEDDEQAEDAESNPPAKPLGVADKAKAPVSAQAPTFVVNGIPTSDPAAVQSHIATLEGFAKESKETARNSFVQKLADEGKITAPMADGFKDLVANMDDEQYELFKAPWDVAAKLPLFGTHGVQASTAGGPESVRADRIKVLQGIVKHHRDGGLEESVIQTKDSYIELQQLLAGE